MTPGGFLAEIVRAARREVGAPGYLDSVGPPAGRSRVSLRAAVERDRARGALVVEFKRVSPGRPDPRLPERPIPEFVGATEAAGVSGYSCLATRARFEGSPSDVRQLAMATARPVLFKDFVVEPVQIDAAERAGASAVLLIARLATEAHLEHPLPELAAYAHDRGLEVLLEFHRSTELSAASGVAADMYGVNVRDLDTLAIERATAFETLRTARERGLAPLLGLSGVEGPVEARAFWRAGVNGILVGSAVARSKTPDRFLKSLFRPEAGGRA